MLWKFEDEPTPEIPSNVMVKKWFPQNDILANPNVVLFIGHGGLFGTSEAAYHGVPLLVIPFFGDQFRNAFRVKKSGYGNFLYYHEITEEVLTKAIKDIISTKAYTIKAKETSAIFKENLVEPMQEAMFWIEYVAKFRGAKHLKSHAVHMSWFSYLLLDIALVNAIIGLVALHLFAGFCCLVYFFYLRKRTRDEDPKDESLLTVNDEKSN